AFQGAKTGTIFLAKAERANKQGLRPYLKRLRIKLDKGCESIYIVSFPPAFQFFDKLLKTLDGHERVFIKNVITTNEYELENQINTTKLKIALLRKNDIYVDETFQSKIETNDIQVGKIVKGTVEHISQNETLVNVMGIRSYVQKRDCSWITINNCSEVLQLNEEYDFQVKNIDKTTSTIHLTMRIDNQNPWILDELPKLNSNISVKVSQYDSIKFSCIYNSHLEVYILNSEISWFLLSKNSIDKLVGQSINAKVIEINEDEQKIFCSVKQLVDNPWLIIHESLPVGTEMTGRVIDVTPHFVDVELPNNYRGRIPKESLIKAGFEYKNFEENIVLGQGIDVVVSKVFIAKQRIRLELKRNVKQITTH
ncbi:MAG TPA: hypothetical protein DHV28_17430, partial [Ignavibacteriales bacterium]|nr:hypothetical protein [Ignavibacteriales bacterium]